MGNGGLNFGFNAELLDHYSLEFCKMHDCIEIIQVIDNSYAEKEDKINRFWLKTGAGSYTLTGEKDTHLETTDKLLIASALGYKDIESFESISKAMNFTDSIVNSFESFSGASNYINDILWKGDTKNCDKTLAHISLIEAVLMLLAYPKKRNTNKYNGYVFRGEYLDKKKYTCESYMSTSCSLQVAGGFGGSESKSHTGSRIIAIKTPELGYLMNLCEIAVCYCNSDLDEYELLMCLGADISVGRQLGVYDGIPVYEACATYNMNVLGTINRICNSFIKAYNTDLVFGIAEIMHNAGKIGSIEGIYQNLIEIEFRNGKVIKICSDTLEIMEEFIVDDVTIPRKYIPLKIRGVAGIE